MIRTSSFYIVLSLTLLLLAFPILHPQLQILGAPVPSPDKTPCPHGTTSGPEFMAPAVLDSSSSILLNIEKRQLLGSLLNGFPNFRNGPAGQIDTDGVVPGGNSASVGPR
ncbi:hypothetical protein FBU30_003783 [Linnemannia zychae]|nr:hypothetical protein FBU30_003783 [Linnemannia zychae]